MYPLPLDYDLVMEFESAITNCSHRMNLPKIIDVPPGERYLDSTLVNIYIYIYETQMIYMFYDCDTFKIMAKLHTIAVDYNSLQPVVSKELIVNCESISRRMQSKFGESSRYSHEIIKAGKNEIFEMLTSNVSLTVQLLDEIRKDPKYVFYFIVKYADSVAIYRYSFRKFICLNDDMDPSRRSENEIVRALLDDFYRSLYPLRSTFELPAQYRNRFFHRHELFEWRARRAKARNLLLCLLTLLLVLTFYRVFCHYMRRLCRIRELPAFFV